MKKEIIVKTAAVLLLILLALWGVKCAKGNDFQSYYDVAMQFRALSPDIYTPGALSGMVNHYPPFFAMIMVPLTLLPPLVAGYIFYLIKMALLAYALYLLPKLFREEKLSSAALALGFIAALRFLNDDFKLGQVNTLVMSLIVIAIYLKNKGAIVLPALLLALSSSIKIYPAIFIVYYLMKKEYRYAAYCLLFTAAFNLLPAIFYLNRYPALVGHFLKESVSSAADAPNAYIANQSIFAMLMRYLGHNPTDTAGLPYINFAALGFAQIKALYYAAASLFFIFMFYMAVKGRKLLNELAVIFIISLIFPMVARKANFVMVLFPAVVMFHEMLDRKSTGLAVKIISWCAFALLVGTSDGLIGRSAGNACEALSLLAVGAILVMAVNAAGVFVRKVRA